jgi:beta-hydroxylase
MMTAAEHPGALPPTFTDPVLQARFERDGFVVVPFLTPGQVRDLRDRFWETHPGADAGFSIDFQTPDPDLKKAVSEVVHEVMDPLLPGTFSGHRGFMTSYLAKWSGQGTDLYLHQDWDYVDERRFRSAVVWCALDDVTMENGPLLVAAGSHRIPANPRGTRTPSAFDDVQDVVGRRLVPVMARAGDAVIMDNALLHASPPNTSGQLRLAVAMAIAPTEAELVHWSRHDERTWRMHRIDEAFFLANTPPELNETGVPADLPVIEEVERPTLRYREDEVSPLLGFRPPGVQLAGRPGRLLTRMAGATVRVNNRVAGPAAARSQLGAAPVLDPAAVPWTAALEAAYPQIRAEVDDLLASGVRLPLIEHVLGEDQGNTGCWRALVLVAHGQPVEVNLHRLPTLARLVPEVPGMQSALLSLFEPGTHLPAHRGPNKGVLRYHLGLIVPGPAGSARLRVEDELIEYREGESVLFDDTYEHEAWHNGDGPRVTLMLEVVRPLPPGAAQLNRLAQRVFGLMPAARGADARVAELDRALNG